MLASYTWSHAIDNVDPDITSQNPNDPNFTGKMENGNAIFDQRQRFVLSGVYVAPCGFTSGGVATLASGLPFNYTTGADEQRRYRGYHRPPGDRRRGGGAQCRARGPDLRYRALRGAHLTFAAERVHLTLRAEALNSLNHANFVGYSGTYGNGSAPGTGFGAPLAGSDEPVARAVAAVHGAGDILRWNRSVKTDECGDDQTVRSLKDRAKQLASESVNAPGGTNQDIAIEDDAHYCDRWRTCRLASSIKPSRSSGGMWPALAAMLSRSSMNSRTAAFRAGSLVAPAGYAMTVTCSSSATFRPSKLSTADRAASPTRPLGVSK